jgi:penicillin-binding protein 1B
VLDRGTGSGARHQGLRDPLAGKTGTTNDRRDSWFVGYASDRVSLVWVGYDDNSTTRLSGSRAALPIWTRYTYSTRPESGFPVFRQPRGIVTASVDPSSGELATGACPSYLTEVFREGHTPNRVCHLHGGHDRYDRGQAEERRRWQWLRKIFGKKDPGKKRD